MSEETFSQLCAVNFNLPIEGLEELFRPWEDNPWVISPEEFGTPDPCSFTGPLAYLSISHDDAVEEYKQMLISHISKEFLASKPELMDLLLDEKTIQVFVPRTWEGIKGIADFKMEVSIDMPKHMKPPARPVNPRIYEPAKKSSSVC